MGLLDFMNAILIFPPAVAIILLSGIVSLATSVVYKYTTDQKLLKQIKDDIKRMQGEIRTTKEPGKAAELQKEVMKRSMRQFNSSTKSTLITIIPLFLIFGWMRAHMAYEPVMPGEDFTTTVHFKTAASLLQNVSLEASPGLAILSKDAQQTSWRLRSEKEGTYQLAYSFGNEIYRQDAIVTSKFLYANPVLTSANGIKKDSEIQKITVDLKSLHPFGNFKLLGWMPGWLATYIISSLIFSMLIRKWLKLS